MTTADTAAKLESIFVDLMRDETTPVRKRTKTNCSHWDSLVQLGLISSIEQEFGIAIGNREAVELNSFESALLIVNDLLAQKA
jgi:acyl carrier protein